MAETKKDVRREVKALTHLRFNDFEVPHLDTARGEVRDFEFHADGSLPLAASNPTHTTTEPTHHAATLFVIASHRRETELCTHEEFFVAPELLDLPDDGRALGGIMHSADVCSETWRVSILGDRYRNLDVVGCTPSLKLGFGLVNV